VGLAELVTVANTLYVLIIVGLAELVTVANTLYVLIIVGLAELVTVANTLYVLIVLEAMQRTIKNATNGKSYCKNSIEIVRGPTSRTHQTL
jgi:hypothetical protein